MAARRCEVRRFKSARRFWRILGAGESSANQPGNSGNQRDSTFGRFVGRRPPLSLALCFDVCQVGSGSRPCQRAEAVSVDTIVSRVRHLKVEPLGRSERFGFAKLPPSGHRLRRGFS